MHHLQRSGEFLEIVYLERDNEIRFQLVDGLELVSTDDITRMDLLIGETVVSSTNQAGDSILWDGVGYLTGEVRMKLGYEDIVEGQYPRCYLTIYDANNPNGLIWGALKLFVIQVDQD